MGSINDIRVLAVKLLQTEFTFNANGVTHTLSASSIGYHFEFGKRKRSFGTCYYTKLKIELSLPLCTENLDKIDTRIRNTILHEIAHALSVYVYGNKNGRGHGDNWQSIAKQIGCDGSRCFDGSTINKPQSKYSLVCDNCGYESSKHRMVTRLYACNKCCIEYNSGKFSHDYRLRIIVNY